MMKIRLRHRSLHQLMLTEGLSSELEMTVLNRDELLYLAKIAEEAERVEDMLRAMNQVVPDSADLTFEEIKMLWIAYNKTIASRRNVLRTIHSIGKKEKQKGSKHIDLLRSYKAKIKGELNCYCNQILNLIDKKLIPKAINAEAQIFLYAKKGDIYRYICEYTSGSDYQMAEKNAQDAYAMATEKAKKDLKCTHPCRLGLALNYSVFQYEINNDAPYASQLAKQAFDDAIAEIDQIEEHQYKDATTIMQLIRDNLTLWTCQLEGALNAQGFSQSIEARQLPDYNHITHSGIFNENYFQVGDRAKHLMEIHHGLGVSNCDLQDFPIRNYFLSLFVKSSKDGQPRTKPINLVIALDVSGSMDGTLKQRKGGQWSDQEQSRIDLAKRAILMLLNKLGPNDVFSLVTFHNQAKTIIASEFVKNLNRKEVEELINGKFQTGGTAISIGFRQALQNIEIFRKSHELINYEHRVIMLTDVCDNSVSGQETLIQHISDCGISTTIVGISTDFKSETCEKLVKVKGFNYLCAVENGDLETYLVDQFDYTFFPCTQDITISITSLDIDSIEVFGSADSDIKYGTSNNTFTVTKMKSCSPSALTINKQGQIETRGGLILVKFWPVQQEGLPKISLKIDVHYSDMQGNKLRQCYQVQKVIDAEQYYSDEAIRKGVQLFYYTQTIRNLLRSMKEGNNTLCDSNKSFYMSKLQKLRQYCPLVRQAELQSLCEIVLNK